MDAAEHEVLGFMDFPREHRAKLHSTNPLERLNSEFKRRSDVAGIFPIEKSIYRLVGALLIEQINEWPIQRRYMTLESLCCCGENPTVSLPTMAR